MHVYDKELCDDDGNILGRFSSHWAACAAMIRVSQPNFKSLSGDKPEDLAVEQRMRETTVTTIPITIDSLPQGPKWDEDGACFVAERCNPHLTGVSWRWVPRNVKATAKGVPDKPLYDFAPVTKKD